jgi:hypothetical protein
MKIINFEDAKAKMRSKEKSAKYLTDTDNEDLEIQEMQRQYREYAQFCNRWYDEHVVGQDENGAWIYKDL